MVSPVLKSFQAQVRLASPPPPHPPNMLVDAAYHTTEAHGHSEITQFGKAPHPRSKLVL